MDLDWDVNGKYAGHCFCWLSYIHMMMMLDRVYGTEPPIA
jgi:hypothetical protein